MFDSNFVFAIYGTANGHPFLRTNSELSNEAISKTEKNRNKVKQNETKTGERKKETWKILKTSYLRLRKLNQNWKKVYERGTCQKECTTHGFGTM